jgi:hypothetical protein
MTKITINFKNFCSLFTSKLNDELMVGLLDLSDFNEVPGRDFHYPKVTIEAEKKIVDSKGETVLVDQWTYEGFGRKGESREGERVFGAIILDVPGVEPRLNKALSPARVAELEEKENKKRPEDKPIKVDRFDRILDIENGLYRDRPLKVNPALCKARFHFRHGTLYSIFPDPPIPIEFFPGGSGAEDGNYPIETGLEIEVPDDGYAALRFLDSDTKDFVFQGGQGKSYTVTIDNSAGDHLCEVDSSRDSNHFQYYYKLVESGQPLDPMYLPRLVSSPSAGDPYCIVSGFGKADY